MSTPKVLIRRSRLFGLSDTTSVCEDVQAASEDDKDVVDMAVVRPVANQRKSVLSNGSSVYSSPSEVFYDLSYQSVGPNDNQLTTIDETLHDFDRHNSGSKSFMKSTAPLLRDDRNKQLVYPAVRTQRSAHRLSKRSDIPAEPVTKFGVLDCLLSLFAIFSFLADIGTDLFLSVLYFNRAQYLFFGLTISLIIIPAVITSCFSIAWYMQDKKQFKELESEDYDVSKRMWCCRAFFHVLQLGPVLRYMFVLILYLCGIF